MDRHRWQHLTERWAAALAAASIDRPGSFERERRTRADLRNALDGEVAEAWRMRNTNGITDDGTRRSGDA